jgi:hypothetical protein
MRLKEKNDYVKSLLSLLFNIRRDTGVPHRIVVDEAHYFLHDADVLQLLDLELAGYTLITYQVSSIHPEILRATEAIIVTRESDPREVRALRAMQGGNVSEAEWKTILGSLAINKAVLLPKTEEACGSLCKFQVAARMTAHVRHQHKYLDLPLPDDRAFVFVQNGSQAGRRARTLKEFAAIVAVAPPAMIDGHLRSHDFSRWIADLFRDIHVVLPSVRSEQEKGTTRVTDTSAMSCPDQFNLRNNREEVLHFGDSGRSPRSSLGLSLFRPRANITPELDRAVCRFDD